MADGAEVFTAYAPIVKKRALCEGDEISDTELENLRRACLFEDTLRRAYYLLGIKDYTAAGLGKKLGGDADITAAAVEKLVTDGYVDDEKYAAARAARLAAKHLSKSVIISKLRFEGVESEAACAAAEEACGEDGTADVIAVINSRYRAALFKEEGRRKVSAALARRGFSYDDINTAIERVMNGEDEYGD